MGNVRTGEDAGGRSSPCQETILSRGAETDSREQGSGQDGAVEAKCTAGVWLPGSKSGIAVNEESVKKFKRHVQEDESKLGF